MMAKASGKSNTKVTLTHPRSGHETKIDGEIYALIRAAILESLRNSDGKTFSQLTTDVAKLVSQNDPNFAGAIPWYTISVRLDLESKGIVEIFTSKGKKLNRLRS